MEQSKKLSKDERIALRASRVQAKRNKEDPRAASALKDKASDDAEAARAMASKVQITASRAVVDAALLAGNNALSDVFVDRQHSEAQRRRRESANREERFARIDTELEQARTVNAELEARWDSVAQHDIPQELYAAISAQYKQASQLLAGKDELIKYLQTQLRHGDEEYVELLSQHQEDVNQALKRMSSNFAAFHATVRKELHDVEATFMKERAELLEKNREEIEALFEKRRKMELVMMESRQARERKFASELLEIRARDAEDYTALKVDLESSIQLFEQQLEEMRATYQLNAEKLEYNHSVLVERDAENKATVEHHRQRLRRLKEALSALIARFHQADAKFKAENAQLSSEFKRATEAFKDLQRKYAHFVTVDTKLYADVWEMNEHHVMQLVHKLLRADQIVHTQMLGVAWKPPLLPHDRARVTVPSQGGGPPVVDIEAITSAQIFAAGQHATAQAELIAQQQKQLQTATGADGAAGGEGSPSAAAAASSSSSTAASAAAAAAAAAPTGSRFTPAQIKSVLNLLGQEVSFLLDSRIQETLQAVEQRSGGAAGAEAEVELYKADGLVAALGVEDREDLDSLVAVFFEGAEGGGAAGASPASGTSGEKPSVHPNDVAKTIKEFVLQRQQVKTKGGAAGGAPGGAQGGSMGETSGAAALAALLAAQGLGGPGGASGAAAKAQHDTVLSEKKARRKERERLFWHYLGHNVVSSHTRSVWSALERWQQQYCLLLEERSKLIDDTTELAKQNEELKVLLQEYLGSAVNQELEIPPTRLIRVAGGATTQGTLATTQQR